MSGKRRVMGRVVDACCGLSVLLTLAACGSTEVAFAGAPVALVITTTPTGGIPGGLLTPQPVVELRDASGNRAFNAANQVTVSLVGTGGSLAGTTTATSVNGVATFTDLRITGTGSFSLTFSSGTLTPVTPAAIIVTNTLFQDTFALPASQLNPAAWTTEVGPASFLGRTQLADWVHPGSGGTFVVGAAGAELALNTFNPTGNSLFGTHGKTLELFQPTATTAIVFTARVQVASVQPGLVFGVYLFGCPGNCATQHDEIDIELVTNRLQPGAPLMVQLNWYSNEPLGAGRGGLFPLPAGFDPLAVHDWTIRWSLARIDFSVDGTLLSSVSTAVPQGPMAANIIAWGPNTDWPAAYNAALKQASSAQQNARFVAYVKSINVSVF
jgi:hypothetical protein